MPNRISISIYPNNEVRAIVGRESTSSSKRGNSVADFCRDDESVGVEQRDRPLDITSKLSGAQRPGFGGLPRPTKFGNNARRTISRCAGVFEVDRLFPDEFLLLTGTIPGSTPQAFEAVSRWSSWVVKTIKTWISDKGVESAYSLYVWEFQKRGALHIHYSIHCPDVPKKVELMRGWKQFWTGVIDGVSERSGVDVWEKKRGGTWATNKQVIQADAQVIRRSVGAYLSKYLSKNAPTNKANPWENQRFHGPVRWWGCSRPLLKRCRELTENFKVECISHSAIRDLKEKVIDIMDWSENKLHSYWDKARSTNVLVTYSPEECQTIFSYLKRDICRPRIAIQPAFTMPSGTDNSAKHLADLKKLDSGQSKDCRGPSQNRTTCLYWQPCLWGTPARWSV